MSKVALVVGGGRNLGAFLSSGLADAGYKVAVADLDGASAEESAAAIAAQFGQDNVMAVQANSTDEADVERMVGAVAERFGRIDLLVYNAGVAQAAKIDETDKIQALDAGADDYLIKPFGIGELLARVRVALRRRGQTPEALSPQVQLGEVTIDLVTRHVSRQNEDIHLTPIEFRLLGELLAHPGKVLTHRQLLLAVWGPTFVEHNHYLRIYMGHLRQKLETDPTLPRYLLTETGIGYRYLPES